MVAVKRSCTGADASDVVTGDLALLLTDDEALGHLAAETLLATDAALGASLYLLRCQDGRADRAVCGRSEPTATGSSTRAAHPMSSAGGTCTPEPTAP